MVHLGDLDRRLQNVVAVAFDPLACCRQQPKVTDTRQTF